MADGRLNGPEPGLEASARSVGLGLGSVNGGLGGPEVGGGINGDDGANHAGSVINEQASEEWEWGRRRTSLLGSLCSRAGHALVLAYSATVTRFSMAESAE